MLDQNYIITVTEANSFLRPKGELPDPSNRGVIKDETGQLSGSVGLNDRWWVEEGASPYASYPDNQLPRYQDIIPRPYSCGDGNYFFRYAGTDYHLYPQVPIRSTSSQYVMFFWSAGDRPNRFNVYEGVNLVFSTGWVGYANYAGPWGPSLSVPPDGSQYISFAGFTGRYVQNEAGPADPNNPVSDLYTFSMTCQEATTTTTTTTLAPATVTLSPQNSLSGSAYSIYINNVVDESFKTGTRSYAAGTSIRIVYTNDTCNVTRNGSSYASNTTFSAVSGTSYTFVFPNANNWVPGIGGVCIGCVSYINEVNDCGTTRSTTPGGSFCNTSASYVIPDGTFHTCSGGNVFSYQVYRNSNECFTGSNQWLMNGVGYSFNPANAYPNTAPNWQAANIYDCYGTCNKYMRYRDVNQCSPTWNTFKPIDGADIVEFNSTFCGGCCGQSTTANWVNTGLYSCYGSCNKYNVEQDNNACSPTYGQTRQGSLVSSNDAFCYQAGLNCCGQSTTANWVNNGDVFCSGCNYFQPQIDNNACSSTYNQTRNVDLGVNSNCGSWPTYQRCEGYDLYEYERNTCTNAIRNDHLVEVNSPTCGYSPCTTYNIIAYNADTYVEGSYTNCGNTTSTFSIYANTSGVIGSVCIRNGTSITITSGNGTSSSTGTMCQ